MQLKLKEKSPSKVPLQSFQDSGTSEVSRSRQDTSSRSSTRCSEELLKDAVQQEEDLWVRDGKILNPEKLFFEEQGFADRKVDCGNKIIAPGFIDVQINGGYGIDFSQATDDITGGVSLVAKRILEHGVTSFCPTLVTSPPDIYHQ
ncbi:N-acetylglucosamine-6-phosphate deacetylase, partial [Silurus asotus]